MSTIIGIVILVLLIVYGVYYSKNKGTKDVTNQTNSEMNSEGEDISANAEQMQVIRLQEGSGEKEAANRNTLAVNYIGMLEDGTVFDQNVDPKTAFTFELGAGEVIKGWDMGLLGMKVGEGRRLVIPAELAYGATGYPPVIPANATLVFDVSLVEIK